MGHVFYDLNRNGQRDIGEAGAPDVVVCASTRVGDVPAISDTTGISGNYVLRTSSEPTAWVTVALPRGYGTTTPISEDIPAVTGIYSVDFGIRAAAYLPILAKDYIVPCIINGGFEDGWTGWVHGGELAQTITTMNPRPGGNSSALLGDPAYVCQEGVPVGSAWMEQDLYVPKTGQPRLSFWYNIFTQDKNTYLSDYFDSFDVRIDGDLRFRDAKVSGAYGCAPQIEKDLGWRTWEIDLSSYGGQLVTIRFENRNNPDGWFNTWTFVDDVRFIP